LIEKGANIDGVYNNGWTSLMFAARNGHKETAKILIEAGADINVTNNNGDNPLDIAITNGNNEIANLIKKSL